MVKKRKNRSKSQKEHPELEIQNRLVGGVLNFLYSDEELGEMWLAFWKLPSEIGQGRASLAEIIEESLDVPADEFDAAPPEQKAKWCVQIKYHPELPNLYGYTLRHLYRNEFSKADALLWADNPIQFVNFASTVGLNPKTALFYLVTGGFGLLLINKDRHQLLLSQALTANGIGETSRN